MSENLTFGVKFTAEDFEKAEELDFAGRLKLCCEKFGAPYPSGIPDVYADGEDPAALIKLDESFFVLELWQDRQVSLAVQSGDFIVTVACLFSAYVDLVCAEEITAGEQISFAVAEKMTAFKNIAEKIPAALPVSIVSADHADEITLEEVNGRIFDEYGYISSRNTFRRLEHTKSEELTIRSALFLMKSDRRDSSQHQQATMPRALLMLQKLTE